jgi:hypothetical protein
MGYNAQSGRVGFKTQAVKGTYADPGAVAPNKGVWMRLRSGSMGGNRDLLVPDPEIGGNRDVPDAQLGPINFPGEYDFYARMESVATLLRAVLGGTPASSGAAGTGYTHVLGTGNVLPWLSVEEVIAGNYQQFKYTDVKANTFHLEADANGYLMGTLGVVGLKQEALTVPTVVGSQRWDTSPLIVGSNILFNYGGVQLPARSFSFDITNNIEDDDFRLGSLFLGDAVEKRREITLGASIRPDDAALWKQAMWGSPVATAPLGMSFKDDVSITIETYEDIPGATAGINYSLTIALPQVIIAPFDMTPSGDDVVTHDIEMRAVRPDPAVDIMTATVLNSYATVA